MQSRCALSQGGGDGDGTGRRGTGAPDTFSALVPHTSPALDFSHPKRARPYPEIPTCLEKGGEILPFPQRVSIELFQLHQPVVFTANIAQHFGSLASLKCKTSPTETFFSCKANTFSVTRNIFLRHEQRVRFLQTKEPKVSLY